jgi:phage terminase large subunit-like protein
MEDEELEETEAPLEYELERYEKLRQELNAARTRRSIDWFKPYMWQKQFFKATLTCKQVTLFAANRVGKTEGACALLSWHLTGEYPEKFNGYKFKHPIKALACGITGSQIRDVLQDKLIGNMDLKVNSFLGGGLIPTASFGPYIMSSGTKGLIQEIKIKHKSGGWSKLMFRSYEQGPAIIRGQSLDWILIDEEPNFRPMEFYAECLSRTADANRKKGGFVCLTFTPENGVTELVDLLLNNKKKGQYVDTVGWDDAPHLDNRMKKQLLQAMPRHMVSAKTKGIPNFGETQVFKITEEEIICDPFEIPKHFRIACGIDFGIAHPFGAVFGAHDVDRDIIYVYDCFSVSDKVPTDHCHLINKKAHQIRLIYPHDANSREKGSGKTLAQWYREAGGNMYRQFNNPDGSIYVEPGILEIQQRMEEGRFKVFSNLKDWWDEFRKYHRNPKNGRIVKQNDDLMDATRYMTLTVPRFGQRKDELGRAEMTEYVVDMDY